MIYRYKRARNHTIVIQHLKIGYVPISTYSITPICAATYSKQ